MVVVKLQEIFSILLQKFDQVAIIIVLKNLGLLLSNVGLCRPRPLEVDNLVEGVLEAELLINYFFEFRERLDLRSVELDVLFDTGEGFLLEAVSVRHLITRVFLVEEPAVRSWIRLEGQTEVAGADT